jgi:hypothetical protein
MSRGSFDAPGRGGKAAGPVTSADMRCFPFSGCLVAPMCEVFPLFHRRSESELFDTDSESDPAQSQQMPGAFKPPAAQAPVRYTCVQDPGEASLGSLLLCVGRTHIIIDP